MRKRDRMITVERVAYHRNGMCGEPFHVVTFTHHVDGERKARKMVGIVFTGTGRVAVFDRTALGRGEIDFGGTDEGRNSWRGDRFEDELRMAVRISEHPEITEFPVTLTPDGRRIRVTIPTSEN